MWYTINEFQMVGAIHNQQASLSIMDKFMSSFSNK
jgi:hypothetical protein